MTEEKTSKRAAAKAEVEAASETVKNWSERQKLHALAQLLRDRELKKAPLDEAFDAWNEQQDKDTQEVLGWLRDAFAKRYQRQQEDGTFAPRVREATTQAVVERLVAFAASASNRDRRLEKDLGLFEYTADELTCEALLALSDRRYGKQVVDQGYHQAQALLRRVAETYGNLELDGQSLLTLVAKAQSGLKTVGGTVDLGLPKKVGGLRTAQQQAAYDKRFAAYEKGLKTKAAKAAEAAEALTNSDGKTTPAVETVINNSAKAEEEAKALSAKAVK
jgi:hypothetical protein